LTKIGIINAQFLHEEKIFPVIPRSEGSAQRSLRHAQNAQKVDWKTRSKISSHFLVKIARRDDAFSEFFKLEASPVEGRSLQQYEKKRRKRKGENNKLKNRKA